MAFKGVRCQCQSQSLLSVGRRTLDGKAGDGSSVVRIRGVGGDDRRGGSRTNFDWTGPSSLRLDSVAEVFHSAEKSPLMPLHRGAFSLITLSTYFICNWAYPRHSPSSIISSVPRSYTFKPRQMARGLSYSSIFGSTSLAPFMSNFFLETKCFPSPAVPTRLPCLHRVQNQDGQATTEANANSSSMSLDRRSGNCAPLGHVGIMKIFSLPRDSPWCPIIS